MDNQHLILEQYRIYTEQKEQFISRNFTTNRFYIILNITLLLLVFLTQDLKMGWTWFKTGSSHRRVR